MIDPKWAEFINEHQAGLGGVLGTVATGLAFLLRQWWSERKEQRSFDAEEKTKGRLLAMVEKTAEDRRLEGERIHDHLTRLIVGFESMLQSQRSMNGKLDKLLGMKGNGHFQAES